MNSVINEIYNTKSVKDQSGKVYPLDYEVDKREGELLFETIKQDNTITKTLEVGCAYGLSSLYICEALRGRSGASHIIIDPFQTEVWKGIGVKNLQDAGLDFYKLIERKSEFVLPDLTEQGEGHYDLIFIDGMHTFDHTLLDCFYATRMLRVGGYLVVDDINMASVRGAVDYLASYPCYELQSSVDIPRKNKAQPFIKFVLFPFKSLGLTKVLKNGIQHKIFENKYYTCFILKKVSEDKRNWYWQSEIM